MIGLLFEDFNLLRTVGRWKEADFKIAAVGEECSFGSRPEEAGEGAANDTEDDEAVLTQEAAERFGVREGRVDPRKESERVLMGAGTQSMHDRRGARRRYDKDKEQSSRARGWERFHDILVSVTGAP
jgi:hypothetical protein